MENLAAKLRGAFQHKLLFFRLLLDCSEGTGTLVLQRDGAVYVPPVWPPQLLLNAQV